MVRAAGEFLDAPHEGAPMRFSDVRDLALPLGRLSAWVASEATLARAAAQTADPRGPSHNQHGHISDALARRVDPELLDLGMESMGASGKAPATGWLGVAFEVPTADGGCLQRAFEGWVSRHETLRSGFRPTGVGITDVEFERMTLGPDEVRFDEVDLGVHRCHHACGHVGRSLQQIHRCRQLAGLRLRGHQVIEGHHGGDGVRSRQHRRVLDPPFGQRNPRTHRRRSRGAAAQLAPVPSYLDFVQDELALASEASASHVAVDTWREFIGDRGTLPRFPLPDGLPPGSQVPQEARCIPIITEVQASAFGAWCRANGASAATGFLATMSLAFTRRAQQIAAERGIETAPDVVGFRSLVSTHTRHSPHWAESIGWFTAIAPFAVEYPADRELIDVLALANESWTTAKQGAGLPMPRISDLLDAPLQPRFVLSYLDARFNRSADRWDDWKAHALIGDVGPTDEVYAWINRMPTETYLTWRFPGNEVCGAEVEAVTKLMAQIILETLSLGSEPIRTPVESSAQW